MAAFRIAAGIVAAALALGLAFGLGAVTAGRSDVPSSASEHAHAHAAAPSEVDIGFAQDMILHHQQAVTMSEMVLERGDPLLRRLADLIRANQLEEIGQLQGLLLAWDQPWLSEGEPMAWMAASGHAHTEGDHDNAATGMMPGMASQAQVTRLGTLTGDQLTATYLRMMIRHHEGTIVMTDAARNASTDSVRDLAKRMSFDQLEEIGQMAQALQAMR